MNITHFFKHDAYHTQPRPIGWLTKTFPSVAFYRQILALVLRSSRLATRGDYDLAAWQASSIESLKILENVGCQIHITGLQHLAEIDEPCVFIGNHMSTLETFALPAILLNGKTDLTYVVKRSLTEYPFFKHVMNTRNPIVVDRVNPRDDLKAVMTEGTQRLESGYSVIIFPQHTRSVELTPDTFNSIGVKLAARTGAKVVPVALLTWAWSQGRFLKDFGPLIPSRPIHFAIGKPMAISGKGQQEHEQVIRFIQEHMEKWRK
ncbi:MAG TPA: lysophospholipid acyltransferase family protein [Desulfuromonadales bacterium]|nr:lysophospholipid acyltransferase family protein [Desulfuromonadales bacterium]